MFIIGYLTITICSFAIAAFLKIRLQTKVWILALMMGIFGFFVVPDITSKIDALPYLYSLNYYRTVLEFKGVGALWHLIEVGGNSSVVTNTQLMTFQASPVMGLIMFICTFLSNPFFLGLIAFLDYFFVLKIIALVTTQNKLPDIYFAISYLIYMCLFVYTNAVGGIRNNLVGTFYAYFFLRYVVNKCPLWSYSTLWLCIVAIILSLIHPFTMLLFIISILAVIMHRTWEYRVIDVLLVFQRFFQKTIINLLVPLSTLPFFGNILSKSDQYLGDNITLFISSRANWIRDVSRLLIMIVILIIVWKSCSKYLDRKYLEFVIMLICFTFGSVHDQVLFERCLLVLLPIMSPFITILPRTIKDKMQLMHSNVLLVSLITLMSAYIAMIFIDNLRAGELYYTFLFNSTPAITGI